MRKSEIRVGGHYIAKVNGKLTAVRVDHVGDGSPSRSPRGRTITRYSVTNLATGYKTILRSAAKFRGQAPDTECPICGADAHDGCYCHDSIVGWPENCPSD